MIIFQMFLKLQLFSLSTLLAVTGYKLAFEESTVFIYYHAVGQFDLPDCLGTLITAKYALTGASCYTKDTYEISSLDFWDSIVFRVMLLNRVAYHRVVFVKEFHVWLEHFYNSMS